MTSPLATALRTLATLAIAAAALMTTAAGETPYRYTPSADDMTLGKAGAPVTVIEYASVGCPHCADWDKEVFPAFKAKYIDTGKVRFVFRELLTGDQTLASAGFLTARCAGPGKYFDVVHGMMAAQGEIFRNQYIRGPMVEVAKRVGMTEDAWVKCVDNEESLSALRARAYRNGKLDDVDSTPTFVVNGVKLAGEKTLEDLDKAISEAAAKVAPPPSRPAPKKR